MPYVGIVEDDSKEEEELEDAAADLARLKLSPTTVESNTSEQSEEERQKKIIRIREYLAACAAGDRAKLKEIAKQRPNLAEYSLSCEVDNEGNTGAHLAARNGDGLLALRWLLLDYGVNVNVTNKMGRTVLMEATLSGCLANVKELVHNAALEIVDPIAKDKDGMQALDLAAISCRDTQDRISRSPDSNPEIRIELEQRERIYEILSPAPHTLSYTTDTAQAGNTLMRLGILGEVSVYRLHKLPPVFKLHRTLTPPKASRDKAFAVLDLGPDIGPVCAMSGHSQPKHPGVLNNHEYTEKAEDLLRYIGTNCLEYACHAEPQLLAYLFHKYSVRENGRWKTEVPKEVRPVIIVSEPKACPTCATIIESFETKCPKFRVIFRFTPGDRGRKKVI